MAKKRTKKKTAKKKPAKKQQRFFKGKNRTIDMKNIKQGKFIPVEAGYVPPFRKSAHFVHDNKGWKLVHAKINTIPGKWKVLRKVNQVPHAWVEALGMVYDPQFEIYMTRKEYYKLFRVQDVKKYSFAQMRAMLDKKRRYGRWEEVLCFESH